MRMARPGRIAWTFADRVATAPAQSRGWAIASGNDHLAAPQLEADEEKAATLATIASRVPRATGFYRATAGPSTLFVTFGPVEITPDEGEPTTLRHHRGLTTTRQLSRTQPPSPWGRTCGRMTSLMPAHAYGSRPATMTMSRWSSNPICAPLGGASHGRSDSALM